MPKNRPCRDQPTTNLGGFWSWADHRLIVAD